jgi:putative restriction endonuclease
MAASSSATVGLPPSNDEIRVAASAAIRQLVLQRGTNVVSWADLDAGFKVKDQTIKFASRAVGIFKPKEITDGAALSIKQVSPSRAGRSAPYEDRDLGLGIVAYRLERSGRDNHLLFAAQKRKTPLVFLRGVADSQYEVIFPVFVAGIDEHTGEALIALSELYEHQESLGGVEAVEEPIAKNYAIGERKTRLHQRTFRQRVLLAYGLRCALTGLPLPELLEAVHIIPDAKGGEATVRNGIALTGLHHTAYELNLLGIDPDGRIHLAEAIRRTRDGPMFEHGLLQLEGAKLRMPLFEGHRPNPDFLAVRFAEFKQQQN